MIASGPVHVIIDYMTDSIHELTLAITTFRDARDWKQFHSPKDMAVGISAEAGELLQHFVWQSPEQSEQRARDRRQEIASELADIGILLFELADNLHIDLAQAIRDKIDKNDRRYPVEKSHGSNKKYNEL